MVGTRVVGVLGSDVEINLVSRFIACIITYIAKGVAVCYRYYYLYSKGCSGVLPMRITLYNEEDG